jgi:hypothetical protein
MDTSTHIKYISSKVHKLPFTISLPFQVSKPKSRVVQPEFRPLYTRNTYICFWDEVVDHSCTATNNVYV